MASAFSVKLRLAAAALGCRSQKELCLRFRAANPATHFDIDRAHKWMQGRALPRVPQVYDDLALVIGSKRSGSWVKRCPVSEFLGELATLYNEKSEVLASRAKVSGQDLDISDSDTGAAEHYLCGMFACYSFAWSPYHAGQLIRGALHIRQSRASALSATYSEALLGSMVRFACDMILSGRSLHMVLRSSNGLSPLFVSLLLPGPPASAFAGVMSGATIVGPDPRPSASRFVAIRVLRDPEATNRYLAFTPTVITDDLRALGLRLNRPKGVDALLSRMLGVDLGPIQVPSEEQAQLAAALDLEYGG
jgi:hypothetical protein